MLLRTLFTNPSLPRPAERLLAFALHNALAAAPFLRHISTSHWKDYRDSVIPAGPPHWIRLNVPTLGFFGGYLD